MAQKQYKYKLEHFATQEEFLHYRERKSRTQKKWLKNSEQQHPERRERRILRQRLYSRYYWRSDGRQSFADWLLKNYGIADISMVSLDDLRVCASKS